MEHINEANVAMLKKCQNDFLQLLTPKDPWCRIAQNTNNDLLILKKKLNLSTNWKISD